MQVSWMNLKPCFTASKVATLIGMNPYQQPFPELIQLMSQLNVPLCMEGPYTRPEEKEQLDRHMLQLVKPHITEKTTVEELQKLEKELFVSGPLGPQAANAARMRYGQVAEKTSIDALKSEGLYGDGQYMKGEFKHFYISGKTDGTYNDKIVEIKNRRSRFLGVTSYERPQFECYMRLFGTTELYLCETLKLESGMKQKLTLVKSDDTLWSLILERLTNISKFVEEVQERPFLQQLDEELLEIHFQQFLNEIISMNNKN